ncbi:MAG: hypothetical protein B7Z70_14925, partial [Acidithiobacillus ferrivorans]
LFLQGDWRVAELARALLEMKSACPSWDWQDLSLAGLEGGGSSTLALLLEWTQEARRQGQPLRIHAASAALLDLARLYHLDTLLQLCP